MAEEQLEQSTEDRLAAHNMAALISSAQEKVQKGKPLTKQEQKAVADAERAKRREAALPYLRAMPKHEFIRLFGGSQKVWLSWCREYGTCWDDDRSLVDAVAMLTWTRDMLATALRPGALKTVGKGGDEELERRRKKAEAEYAELKVARARGEMCSIEEVERDFTLWAGEMRSTIENFSSEVQRAANETLDRIEEAYANSYGHRNEEEQTAPTGQDTSGTEPSAGSADA